LALIGVLIVIAVVTSIRWINPFTSSVMLQQNLVSIYYKQPLVNYKWVDWEKISPQMPLAVVASEDQRFPVHHGIDFKELKKAISQGGRRGASTISQQVAKNMFLWQGRSYLRKAIEAVLALYIDLVWGKQRVLEVYLNVAYFGGNLYGIGTASEVFFNKKPGDINRFEAARLAAVLPNPRKYSANNASSYIVERQSRILRQMQGLGGVSYINKLD
jgi:monofunctional biosynthetic peptidoglycan transglycosylase